MAAGRVDNRFAVSGENGDAWFRNLTFSVEIEGRWLQPESWSSDGSGLLTARLDGFELELRRREEGDFLLFRGAVRNHSGGPVRIGRFRWRGRRESGDLFSLPGERFRVYSEAWTMPAVAGSHRFGECDFPINPGYLRCAVSEPESYDSSTPNRFAADYMLMLNDRESGSTLLAGFVTSGAQTGRFGIELDGGGVAEFHADSCCDRSLLPDGARLESETLAFLSGNDDYRLASMFAARWGEAMGARIPAASPTGWCSWYYYFADVTEKDIIENVDFLRAHRGEYPLEYIQVDDGYQAACGDWLCTNDKFPHGLGFLADRIREAGFRPALWLAPFLVEERSRLVAEHPEWLVHNSSGDVIWAMEWRGCRAAVLDGTHPGAQAWLTALFRKLAELGFDYVKLDFLVYEASSADMVYYDGSATRAQALRRGMEAIRAGFGEERFILGCTALLGSVAGIVDAERISTDISPYWGREKDRPFLESIRVPNVCRNIINRTYLHNRLWANDPDVLVARDDSTELTRGEIELCTSALYLSGGLTLCGDRFSTLSAERAELVRFLLAERDPVREVRPLDRFERIVPAIWFGHRAADGAPVVGLFNFDEEPLRLDVALPEPATGVFRDRWSGERFSADSGRFSATVPPHCCRLLFPEAE